MALAHRLLARAARLWWRVRRPRTIGVRGLVVDGAGRIALVRHTYRPYWYLPGGGVKTGESIDRALLRELREEVALADARIDGVLGVYHSRAEYKDDHVVVLTARSSAPVIAADALEIAEAGWFALDALPADLSPATARRIEEFRERRLGLGDW
jgi:ADP-ribose pyrophosphatase YjhB (NUDIX family)